MATFFNSILNNIAVFPFMTALITALIGLFWRTPSIQRRALFGLSAVGQFLISLYIYANVVKDKFVFLAVGGWKPPFGIAITIDMFSSIFMTITTFLVCAGILYIIASVDTKNENSFLLPLIQFMTAGILLSFSTGDFFNLFVSFEIFLIASYALLSLSSKDISLKRTFPYLGINVLGGTLFVVGAAFVYGMYGTLNFATIAAAASNFSGDPKLFFLASFLVLVFGIKAGFFPMFYWLPRAYSSLPAPIAALFAGLLTKVGLYAIIRTVITLFPAGLQTLYETVGVLAIFTMIVPIIISLSRNNIREVLCYNLVSHIGFLMVAIAAFTGLSMTGAVFYMMHHMIVISSLFLITGLVIQLLGTDEFEKSGNLWKAHGFLGLLFFLQALSLAGLPPFSGFWGKFMIVKSLITLKHESLLIALILASILTLLSMIRIWFHVFLKKNENTTVKQPPQGYKRSLAVVTGVVVISLSMGLFPAGYIEVAFQSVKSLNNKPGYLNKVLSYKQIRKPETHGTGHHEDKAHGATHGAKHHGAEVKKGHHAKATKQNSKHSNAASKHSSHGHQHQDDHTHGHHGHDHGHGATHKHKSTQKGH